MRSEIALSSSRPLILLSSRLLSILWLLKPPASDHWFPAARHFASDARRGKTAR